MAASGKTIAALFAALLMLTACMHVPQAVEQASSVGVPDRPLDAAPAVPIAADEAKKASWYVETAEYLLNAGDVSGAFHGLVSALAAAETEPPDGIREDDSLRKARDTLARLSSHLMLAPADGWILQHDWLIKPADPNAVEVPSPTFQLYYQADTSRVRLGGIRYTLHPLQGGEIFPEGGKTDQFGYGSIMPFQRKGFDRAAVRLSFSIRIDGYEYPLAFPAYYLVLPEPMVEITVRVGERMETFVQRLEEAGLTTREALLSVAHEQEFPEWAVVPPPRAEISRFEGLFAPGSYRFPQKDFVGFAKEAEVVSPADSRETAEWIIRRVLEESASRHLPLQEVNGLGLYDQIILASIVEKEAASRQDYDKVASVFYNRLAGGSRLASCPTVEYALGYHRPFLTQEDIAIDSPYNVYIRSGLPPTPICFFSDEALAAVRAPVSTDLYYFVYDWTREKLQFASNYQDHLANAQEARANYAKEYGKDALHEIFYDRFYEN